MEHPSRKEIAQLRNNRAGCLVLKINRLNQYVGIYKAKEQSMDNDGKYLVVCETHHTLVFTNTREQANTVSKDTTDFCDECKSR